MPTRRKRPLKSKPWRCGSAALIAATTFALAQVANAQAANQPLTQDELLKQIETLSPASTDPGRTAPAKMAVPGSAPKAPTASSTQPSPLFGDLKDSKEAPPIEKADKGDRTAKGEKGDKKGKGPTEIVALEATFDQKAHVAVFIGQVVVTDPEFTVHSDKLTAYLKHDDKTAAPGEKAKPAAPAPAPKGGDDSKQQKSGGLDHAIAEADPGNIVTVTQDKTEADGTITHSIGHGRRVLYDTVSGDITLLGHPDSQQGVNSCVSTDDNTVMVMNRDGRMKVTGPHKTLITDMSDSKPKPDASK